MNPALSLAAARIVVGAAVLAAPTGGARLLRLDPTANPQLAYMTRLFGGREIALGAATLLVRGPAQRQLVTAGIAVDAADAVAAFLAGRDGSLSRPTALLLAMPAVLAAASGVSGIRQLGAGLSR
ncbi:MAG: hypothetical protein ACXWDM_01430 [Nocardioides sp.]